MTSTERGAIGPAGNITINTEELRVSDRAVINALTGNPSRAGNININVNDLILNRGGQVLTLTRDQGRAGNIHIYVNDDFILSGRDPNFQNRTNRFNTNQHTSFENLSDIINNQGAASGLFANTQSNSSGHGGSIDIHAANLTLNDSATISARSQGQGNAGNISLNTIGELNAINSSIITSAENSSGGAITITSSNIRLRGNSDIRTNVQQGASGGGNIDVNAHSLIAFDNSDIIAAARDSQGGNIDFFRTIAFFENFDPNAANADPDTLENNDRADINATGAQPGIISIFDTTFIQNSLNDLPDAVIDTDSLIANSCIARTKSGGTFLVTGSGGLPPRPGVAPLSPYPAGTVRTEPDEPSTSPSWKPGDAIVEPQGVYRLPNGQLVMSRECAQVRDEN